MQSGQNPVLLRTVGDMVSRTLSRWSLNVAEADCIACATGLARIPALPVIPV